MSSCRIKELLFTLSLVPYPIKGLNFQYFFFFFFCGGAGETKNSMDKGVFKTFKTGGF